MSREKDSSHLAILGAEPAFKELVMITKPTISSIPSLKKKYGDILKSGMITNGRYVRDFEDKVAKYLGVRNAVALNSCTGGLMLLMKVLNLTGEVIVPSFTFHATAHAVVWSGLKPVFVDCDPKTFNISPEAVQAAITSRTSAVLAVHVFGNPCSIGELESITNKHGLPLIFDSAHGFGATYKNRQIGSFGRAEVFSLSPTKLLTAGDGGIAATNDDSLAEKIRTGRNYGDPGTYDSEFSGFNARMSEFHALLGIECLKDLEKNVVRRNRLATLYKKLLANVPGLYFQEVETENRSTFKDFSVLVNEREMGLSRDVLSVALAKENITTKKYFSPPVHEQKAFKGYYKASYRSNLPATKMISRRILNLPIYSHMPESVVRKICTVIEKLYHRAQ